MPAAAETFRRIRAFGSLEIIALASVFGVAVLGLLLARQWDLLPRLAKESALWTALLLLFVVILPLALWHQVRFARRARLLLDADGMTMRSGLPRFLQAGVASDWSLRWDDIERVLVLERLGVLHIKPKGGLLRAAIPLRPADWAADDGRPLAAALAQHDLYGRGVSDPGTDTVNFDLWRHRATRAVLVVCAVLAAYALLDSLARREAWAEWSLRYNVPHGIAGVLAACVAGAFLWRAAPRVPGAIGAILALIAGVSAATASYSALIRVNQALGGPLEAKAYHRNASCDALVPTDPGLPTIEYTELAQAYWCSFPADARHEVRIRRGIGGLYQVDLDPHTEAIRKFRASRRI